MAATAPTNKNARMEVLPLVLPPRRRRLPVAASTLLSRGGSAPSTRFGAHGHGTTSPLRVQMNGGSRRMDGKKRAVNQGRATHFRFTTISPCTWQYVDRQGEDLQQFVKLLILSFILDR
ncbi:uncharacterized protein LOC110432046 isoform X1 [Sorghum bicolor]|nr:uncharacterized protein LOC110432046 isoform X1 [Sorghum bicolor]|eukprot:XP_021307693.1 uncharacterized protein LOC110432046 isoform X1 [Sorghum bicolor]